jgi:hypothetical protein
MTGEFRMRKSPVVVSKVKGRFPLVQTQVCRCYNSLAPLSLLVGGVHQIQEENNMGGGGGGVLFYLPKKETSRLFCSRNFPVRKFLCWAKTTGKFWMRKSPVVFFWQKQPKKFTHEQYS